MGDFMNARNKFTNYRQAGGATDGGAMPNLDAACGPSVTVPLEHYVQGRVLVSRLPRRAALNLVARLIEEIHALRAKLAKGQS
jgi:hypothetical protein